MIIPSWTPITKDDFPSLDDEVARAFGVLNEHLEKVTQALKKRLTFADNFNSEEIYLHMQNNSVSRVTLQRLNGRPRGVILVATEGHFDVHEHAANVVSENELDLRVRFDTEPREKVWVRWLAIGG